MILKLKEEPFEYDGDVDRIVQAFLLAGYQINAHDARRVWECHSESRCAGWLILPEDNLQILRICLPYFEEVRA